MPSELEVVVSPLNKGLGFLPWPVSNEEIPALGWNLLREDLSLPAAVLYNDKIEHNLAWMRRFVSAYGVKLCPHGKTTMAPSLFRRQIAAGAWGITLATAHQAQVAYAHGIRRILLANQLVGRQNLEIFSRMLEDPQFEFFCLVDSPAHVRILGDFFRLKGQSVQVFVEVGTEGGRAGIRNLDQIDAIVRAQRAFSDTVKIVGVELFEGIFKEEATVRAFLESAVSSAKRLIELEAVQREPLLLSGAGSAWFDVVAEVFTQAQIGVPTDIVLRPGCYITHDYGSYAGAQKRMLASNQVVQSLGEGLVPSLHLWAYVQSIPEPDLAIIGLGKRDASFDSGLPIPALRYRPGDPSPNAVPPHWEVTKLMDQHGFLSIKPEDHVAIGDMIAFDISHPCLTFDKWRYLAVLDNSFTVTELVETFF
jgi:D-serine dehydratase